MNKLKWIFVLFVWLACLDGFSQDYKHFISFSDKPDSSYSFNHPEDFLSQRSLERREKEGVILRQVDLPVYHVYVDSLNEFGIKLGYKSRWFNGVYATIPDSLSSEIEMLSFVVDIDTINRFASASKSPKFTIEDHIHSKNAFSESQVQLDMIGVDEMLNFGFNGKGVLVGVFDGGFNNVEELEVFEHLYNEGRIIDTFDVVQNDSHVYHGSSHGTNVLSVLAGIVPEVFSGAAPGATYALYRTENTPVERRVEEYNWLIAAERADSLGVDIINSSLSYNEFDANEESYSLDQLDGETAVITRAANFASGAGILVVTSAGNEGGNSWGKITAPADSEKALAVAAVSADESRSNFSSIGPTADQRIKPDLAAQGGNVTVLNASGNTSITNGTSFSAPLIAGLAAGVMQLFPERSSQEIKAMLLASGSLSNSPNEELGYGIPDFNQIIANEAVVLGPTILGFELFPNPIKNGELHIVNDYIDGKSIEVHIFNSVGQEVMETTYTRHALVSQIGVNAVDLDAGMYYIQIGERSDFETVRVVKY